MKKRFTKIAVFILIGLIIVACNSTKRVPGNKRLLTNTEIVVDDKATSEESVFFQLYQKPNSSILGYRLRLQLYNLAKKNADTSYAHWLKNNPNTHSFLTGLLSEKQVNRLGKSFVVSGFSNFLKKTGEAPVLFDTTSTKKSLKRLNYYYYNKGYFDVKSTYQTDTTKTKKLALKYLVNLGQPYIIDSIKTEISSPALDSIYKANKANAIIKNAQQYTTENFNAEKNRITSDFRNNGAFTFQSNYIFYELDTIKTNKKTNVSLIIKDESIRENDTSRTQPFKIYKINKVNVFTDFNTAKTDVKIKDSIEYKNFHLYAENKIKYRPSAIVNSIFITPGSLYSDNNTALTTKFLSNLKVFNYPTIQYKPDPKDENGLIANIYLKPRKKYSFGYAADFIHSNIQDFGISGNTSVGIRNVFNGAETFQIGLRGNVGASRAVANPNNNFFNISEIGIDSKLNFPRIFFPFNTDNIIPKNMIPSTTLSVGFSKQRNIGLDKQNLTSSFSYNWTPRKNMTIKYDLFNIQFIKNVNVGNYFNVYQSSYNTLNSLAYAYASNFPYFDSNHNLAIESGTNAFINNVLGSSPTITPNDQDLKTIRSIVERKNRLTENNLIFASSFSFSKTTKQDNNDNDFFAIKTKIESAGNFLSILARASKQLDNQAGANTFFDVQYSQYLKTEFEYIKHWDLSRKKVIAIRSFSGLAVPYGNSKSIPFSRSYFSGGSNDNRAWQPYSLGPGSSGGINDFNEANMKLAFDAEFRFNILGKFNGVVFTDMGNIWNIFDDVEDDSFKFKGLSSIKEVAIGSGLGLRYDQGLFVVRFDVGFKTYNPSKYIEEKWFREINLYKSVLNIGINYPF